MRLNSSASRALMAAALGGVLMVSTGFAASTPLKNLVLKQNDVPGSFTSKTNYSHEVGSEDAVTRFALKKTDIAKEGRLDGYESLYSRTFNGASTAKGFYAVADEIEHFKSTSGSTWLYNRLKRSFKGKLPTIGNIGDARIGDNPPAIKNTRTARVVFRRGTYVVSVTATNIGKGSPFKHAVHYAQVVDNRIKSASS